MLSVLIFFFFFQAEDGIRAGHVTGVQTCALPISSPSNRLVTEPSSKTARMARASRGAIDSWERRSNCVSGGIATVLVHTTSRTEQAFRGAVAAAVTIGGVAAATTEGAPSASRAAEAR